MFQTQSQPMSFFLDVDGFDVSMWLIWGDRCIVLGWIGGGRGVVYLGEAAFMGVVIAYSE